MPDLPLLVVSCDRYSDLWAPFFGIFWRRWPDCPFPVHLAANRMTHSDPRVVAVPVGEDSGWGEGLRRALGRLGSKYVLLFLEDFFLEQRVNTLEVLRLADIAVTNNVGCLRLAPHPRPSRTVEGHADLGWILPKDPYRVSTQVTLWRVETLASLLRPSFTAWDFELKGSLLSADLREPFWSVWKPAVRCRHAVERGVWLPWGLAACRAEGVEVDLTARRAMTKDEIWRWRFGALRGKAFWSLPAPVRRRRWLRIASGM